tara:strand:- start:3163 stop:3369 length:207 start_codon:yes stop_codon:yes gene_type:complete
MIATRTITEKYDLIWCKKKELYFIKFNKYIPIKFLIDCYCELKLKNNKPPSYMLNNKLVDMKYLKDYI